MFRSSQILRYVKFMFCETFDARYFSLPFFVFLRKEGLIRGLIPLFKASVLYVLAREDLLIDYFDYFIQRCLKHVLRYTLVFLPGDVS